MAGEIAGRPHWEVGFDERGTPDQGEVAALLAELPGQDLTDLLVFSHGWNSDRRQGRPQPKGEYGARERAQQHDEQAPPCRCDKNPSTLWPEQRASCDRCRNRGY